MVVFCIVSSPLPIFIFLITLIATIICVMHMNISFIFLSISHIFETNLALSWFLWHGFPKHTSVTHYWSLHSSVLPPLARSRDHCRSVTWMVIDNQNVNSIIHMWYTMIPVSCATLSRNIVHCRAIIMSMNYNAFSSISWYSDDAGSCFSPGEGNVLFILYSQWRQEGTSNWSS